MSAHSPTQPRYICGYVEKAGACAGTQGICLRLNQLTDKGTADEWQIAIRFMRPGHSQCTLHIGGMIGYVPVRATA